MICESRYCILLVVLFCTHLVLPLSLPYGFPSPIHRLLQLRLQLVSMSVQLIPRDGCDSRRQGSNSHNGLHISGCCGLVRFLKQRNLQHPINDESHRFQCLTEHLHIFENLHRCAQEYNDSSCSRNLPQVRLERWMCGCASLQPLNVNNLHGMSDEKQHFWDERLCREVVLG